MADPVKSWVRSVEVEGRRPGQILVLRGGVLWIDYVNDLSARMGARSMGIVTHREHVAGQFNSHLAKRDLIIFWPLDRPTRKTLLALEQLATSDEIEVRRKGSRKRMVQPNRAAVLMLVPSGWSLPEDSDERLYLICDPELAEASARNSFDEGAPAMAF